jgi:hypothetical protein
MKSVNYGYDNTLLFNDKNIEQITSLDFETNLDLLEVYFAENKGKKSTFPKGRDVKFPFTALRCVGEDGEKTVQDELVDLAFSLDEKELVKPGTVKFPNGKQISGNVLWNITQIGAGATEEETYLEGEAIFQGDWVYEDQKSE